MKPFIHEDFLLTTEAARELYHDYAEIMPIIDYHCHVPPKQIAENTQFKTITEIWLGGDHYKWRAMRAVGVDEDCITGKSSDLDTFKAWARTVPKTLGNPLYHWSHLELKRVFGIDELLNEERAENIYHQCNELLMENSHRVRGLIEQFRVEMLCTTDDPADTLEHHRSIAGDSSFPVKVLPAWRPDRCHAVEDGDSYRTWIRSLGKSCNKDISSYDELLSALDERHQFFHDHGCRISDHGISCLPLTEPVSAKQMDQMFRQLMEGNELSIQEIDSFRITLLTELAKMDASRGWTMQLHLGALRNVNSKMYRRLGPDTGYDVIGDFPVARSAAAFLDRLNIEESLPRMILYSLHTKDFEVLTSLLNTFADGKTPGKIQLGAGWWYHDQYDGMMRQMRSLASIGILSTFAGMTTDSRSFLSYPRHEYFRRVLSELLGKWMHQGFLPNDFKLIGSMLQDICYRNACTYFNFP